MEPRPQPPFTTPKLHAGRSARWYPYYAGYNTEFVRDVLAHLDLPEGSVVLDPWNGSGTTTVVARERGFETHGFDLNPALVSIARARLVGREIEGSLRPLAADILVHAGGKAAEWLEDPLRRWLHPDAAEDVRAIERSIRAVLTTSSGNDNQPTDVTSLSSLASFFYVALFAAVRDALGPFNSTNPTWIRSARSESELLHVDGEALKKLFLSNVVAFAKRLSESPATHSRTRIEVGDSLLLQEPDAAVAAVVTSPPYCTRIDYVVATLPELAVLGYGHLPLTNLRHRMLGTPKLGDDRPQMKEEWGETALNFIGAVAGHRSKASSTYYSAFFHLYFDRLYRSLGEIRRVLKLDGPFVLVVQDSYYKEIHADLARMATEMLRGIGFGSIEKFDFAARSVIAASNPRAREYRTTFSATETVLICR